MADIASELLKMKRRIEETKDKKSRLEGKLSSLQDRLRSEFNCKTLEEGEAKQQSLSKELKDKQIVLERKLTEMRESYAF
jgi:predicted transcriptional regulator